MTRHLIIDGIIAAVLGITFWALQRRANPCPPPARIALERAARRG